MFLFSEAISKKAPVEIPLKGRIFTWSNVQDAPSLEKLDWSFSSQAWTLTYPSTFPYPLAKTTCDHVAIFIKICTSIPKAHIFILENYYMEHRKFKDVVKGIWEQ